MKMVPSVMKRDPGESTAERIVFDLLRASEIPGTAFHSLLLSQHEVNPTGEADRSVSIDSMHPVPVTVNREAANMRGLRHSSPGILLTGETDGTDR